MDCAIDARFSCPDNSGNHDSFASESIVEIRDTSMVGGNYCMAVLFVDGIFATRPCCDNGMMVCAFVSSFDRSRFLYFYVLLVCSSSSVLFVKLFWRGIFVPILAQSSRHVPTTLRSVVSRIVIVMRVVIDLDVCFNILLHQLLLLCIIRIQ